VELKAERALGRRFRKIPAALQLIQSAERGGKNESLFLSLRFCMCRDEIHTEQNKQPLAAFAPSPKLIHFLPIVSPLLLYIPAATPTTTVWIPQKTKEIIKKMIFARLKMVPM